MSIRERCVPVMVRQTAKPARADSIAASITEVSACSTVAMTSPVAGFTVRKVTPPEATYCPCTYDCTAPIGRSRVM